ncbi:hypothetical protein PTKIN_Ptkin01aG0053800 [Pterospermum kingtungense]
MENEESSSRPSIGFPLGLAILLMLLFCISGILICYLHWHKLRALIRQSSDHHPDNVDDFQSDTDRSQADDQASSPVKKPRQKIEGQISLPVLMPGDQVPRFIAMACPCEPSRLERITIRVQKPPPDLPVPFYYS